MLYLGKLDHWFNLRDVKSSTGLIAMDPHFPELRWAGADDGNGSQVSIFGCDAMKLVVHIRWSFKLNLHSPCFIYR